jgi:hypothetical protein
MDDLAFLDTVVEQAKTKIVTVKKPKEQGPRYSDEQMAAKRHQDRAGIGSPKYESLIAHMQRFGPEGIIEAAIDLPEEQQDKLERMAKRMSYDKARKKWELK